MPHRLKNRLKFRLERWLQRGALFQLVVIAALIVAVAVAGGLVAWAFSGVFATPPEAIWWAFLRLTDPGYLGDDAGLLLRTVSTVVTVLGYVLFMGSLIAIMTQWLNGTLRTLERGLTPIALRDHLLILGWTNRTAAIVRELMMSEGRVQRFLQRRGTSRLRIVILADHVDAALTQELREELGRHWDRRRILLRSGSSLRIEHLRRVAYHTASVVLLPGADFRLGGAEATDARVIKTLLSISNQAPPDAAAALPAGLPTVVAEIFDAHKIPIARQAYAGEIDVVAGDAFIGRLIAQNVRHPGLSFVYGELLSYSDGNEIYVRHLPDLAGAAMADLADAFSRAILLGAVRPEGGAFRAFLNPPPDFMFEPDDRLVLVARTYEESAPAAHFVPVPGERARIAARERPAALKRRILFLGWSHKIVALLREFEGYACERFEIDVLSVVPAAERTAHLARYRTAAARVAVRQLEGDYTVREDLVAIDPLGNENGYDNVVLLGSDWLETEEESDARTILGYVLLRSLMPEGARRPEVLVELMDPENARLFRQRTGEVIISPVVLSHVMAHVALRRELSTVFSELFGPQGAEIFFRPARAYDLVGTEVDIRDVRRSAARYGEIALGVRLHAGAGTPDGGIRLNPPPEARWRLTDADEVILLATGE